MNLRSSQALVFIVRRIQGALVRACFARPERVRRFARTDRLQRSGRADILSAHRDPSNANWDLNGPCHYRPAFGAKLPFARIVKEPAQLCDSPDGGRQDLCLTVGA